MCIFLSVKGFVLRESISRQVDKKSGVPKGEKGVWGSQGGDAAAAAKSLQSCPILCDPKDGSPPGPPPIPGILQARTLEWVAMSFSRAWKWKVKVKSLSRVRLLATPRTAAYQAPLFMGFVRQEYWSGVPLPILKEEERTNFFSTFLSKDFITIVYPAWGHVSPSWKPSD